MGVRRAGGRLTIGGEEGIINPLRDQHHQRPETDV